MARPPFCEQRWFLDCTYPECNCVEEEWGRSAAILRGARNGHAQSSLTTPRHRVTLSHIRGGFLCHQPKS